MQTLQCQSLHPVKKEKNNSSRHLWSKEEREYLKEICNGHTYKEIIELFKIKFNVTLNRSQVKHKLTDLKLFTNTRNFKKGHKINEKPIGSEVFRLGRGYNCWFIKVDEKNWVKKHHYIYEKTYGKIPKGHTLIFADGNKDNFEIDNLICLSMKEFLFMSGRNMFYNNKEYTYTSVNLARLMLRISDLNKKRGKNNVQ